MIHPDSELQFVSEAVGYGVVATRLIPRGSITWVLDDLDQVLTPHQVSCLPAPLQQRFHKYSFLDGEGNSVLCWDLACYVNHSCQANCMETGFGFEIAISDILPGQQLTDDYATLNISQAFTCACHEPVCREIVRPDDSARYSNQWRASVIEAFPLLDTVPQPLLGLVRRMDEVTRAMDDPGRIPCFDSTYISYNSLNCNL